MKIKSVSVHNWRSFADAEFAVDDYAILIGANNCGKSNIIDAIRAFYDLGTKFVHDRDFPRFPVSDHESWIEMEFTLTETEFNDLKEDYRQENSSLKVRKYLLTDKDGSANDRKSGIYGYIGDDLSTDMFYGATNVQQGKFGNAIYIPAVSNLDEHTKLTGPSPLRELLNTIFKELARSSNSFAELANSFSIFNQAIRDELTLDHKSITGLESDFNAHISEWGAELTFSINPVDETDIIKNLLSYQIIDTAMEEVFDVSQFGHGFQRHLIYTLIRLAAQYRTAGTAGSKKDFSPNLTLILFEEPEAFLHPGQQTVLCRNLQVLSSEQEYQCIISSHSTQFVAKSTKRMSSIVRINKESAVSRVRQIGQTRLEEIFASNLEINSLVEGTRFEADRDDYRLDMEAAKHFLWLDENRCGLFFANHVLLVEGPSERVAINYALDTGALNTPQGGVFILDCIGKFNIHRFMNLLGEVGVRHSVLFDGDGGREPHRKIADLISASANKYTTKICALPHDLEAALGIPKAKEPHRKPQHVLLKLQEGSVEREKFVEFVAVVQGLLCV